MSAAAGEDEQAQKDKTRNTVLFAGLASAPILGCLAFVLLIVIAIGTLVACLLGFVFWPLMLLCKINLLPCGDDSDGGGLDNDQVIAAYESDGKGQLNSATIPSQYVTLVEEAGNECTQIGAIVIAAQIQLESGWNEKLVGPDGAEGISQVPPDKFKEFGEDADDNDKTSGLDAADSIKAQSKYMCSLAKEIDTLIANNEVKGDPLNLTLAAYDSGLDAVKQAKGVPDNDRAQSYIIGVRSGFALYSNSVDMPYESPYPSLSPRPTPSS
ncbi:transglycosylase SLT domain-containing protein [Streptomyces sp. HUAS ZL42]|uniref:transglycosylase SLT domain-containing protein n=1 Tax=Streptomyces sp. HUAS ZL42 TaxID=3231715 RepID=UPI00345E7CED